MGNRRQRGQQDGGDLRWRWETSGSGKRNDRHRPSGKKRRIVTAARQLVDERFAQFSSPEEVNESLFSDDSIDADSKESGAGDPPGKTRREGRSENEPSPLTDLEIFINASDALSEWELNPTLMRPAATTRGRN